MREGHKVNLFLWELSAPPPRQSVPSAAVQAKHRLLSTLACRVITSDWEPARQENWPALLFQQVWITQPIPPPNTASFHLYSSCFAASLPSHAPPETPTPDPGGLLAKYAFNLSNTHGHSARNTHTHTRARACGTVRGSRSANAHHQSRSGELTLSSFTGVRMQMLPCRAVRSSQNEPKLCSRSTKKPAEAEISSGENGF